MPHINVKMFPGRDEAKKKELAEKLLLVAQETLGCNPSALSVSVQDIPKEEWNEKVGEAIPEDAIFAGKMYKVK